MVRKARKNGLWLKKKKKKKPGLIEKIVLWEFAFNLGNVDVFKGKEPLEKDFKGI